MSNYAKGKLLSLILRHKPELFNIDLDTGGFAKIDQIIKNTELSLKEINSIVKTNNKKRFEIVGDTIRAVQGHSISTVDIGLASKTPPDVLYHGTVERFHASIKEGGIKRMKRNYVHLSADMQTASAVALRRGDHIIIFHIDAKKMCEDGNMFYCSKNGVWLTKHIPYEYVSRYEFKTCPV